MSTLAGAVGAAGLVAIVSAIGFRIRGGLFGVRSHFVARMAWALPLGSAAALVSGDVYALVIAPALFAVCTLPTFHAIDAGRVDGSRMLDAFANLCRGFAFSLAAAASLLLARVVDLDHARAVLALGLGLPLAYELGWRTPSTIRGLERGSEIAEAYFGAVFGAGLTLALLL